MSAAVVLPFVWAFAPPERRPSPPVEPHLGFYRKYTTALLRRYVRMSLEAGRVPSLLGQEMFRAKVSNYRVESFEDVVIFLHDMERCLEKLTPEHRILISRMALEEYTVAETSAITGLAPRSVIRRYSAALDRLTRILLNAEMLHMQNCVKG